MLRRFVLGLGAACLVAASAQASPVTSLTVSGQVGTPGSYTAADLGLLPQTTQSVTYLSGSTPRSDTFTGPSLWNVLQSAGGVTVSPVTRNGVLRNYVIVTGSDGHKAVLSLGEIAPSFGNTPAQVATGAASGSLPDPDGFARVTVPGDVRGGRYVSNVVDLEVGIAPLQQGSGGGVSGQLAVQGAVDTPMTWDLAALQALTPTTQTVTYQSGASVVTETFTGALLWDVLNASGIITDPGIRNDILRKIVVATGSDGYQTTFALGELSPMFGNAPIFIAYADSSGLLTDDGFARIVSPGDVRGGRYVSNLVSLTVLDATTIPEPTTLAMALFGIAALLTTRRILA